jgi:hypothetical protein
MVKLTGDKWKNFLLILPVQTTKHLERLLKQFPNHRFRKQIEAELMSRKGEENASKI